MNELVSNWPWNESEKTEHHIPFEELMGRVRRNNTAVELTMTLWETPEEPTKENIEAVVKENERLSTRDLERMIELLDESETTWIVSSELSSLAIWYISYLSIRRLHDRWITHQQTVLIGNNSISDIEEIFWDIYLIEEETYINLLRYWKLVKDNDLIYWITNKLEQRNLI